MREHGWTAIYLMSMLSMVSTFYFIYGALLITVLMLISALILMSVSGHGGDREDLESDHVSEVPHLHGGDLGAHAYPDPVAMARERALGRVHVSVRKLRRALVSKGSSTGEGRSQ